MKQRGFTLIEILVVTALGSIIALGAMLTIQQIYQNTSRSNSQVVVLDDINRVVLQIKRDIQSYQTANLTDLQNGPTTFYWTNLSGFEPDEERDHYSTYSLSETILTREADNVTEILGRHIDSLSFTQNGDDIDIEITAVSTMIPPKSETITFSMRKRTYEME